MAVSNDMAGYWAPVENAMGVKGTVYDDGTLSFDIPRNISVTLDGVKLAEGSDLSHEVHLMKTGNQAMIMGELVVMENEVNAITQKLIVAGLNETALHNHMLREKPHILYMHFNGYGDPVALAGKVRDITESLSGGVARSDDTTATDMAVSNSLDTARLDRITGGQGKADGGVYSYSIPRGDNVTMNGMTLSPHMDISEQISFQPLGSGKAALVGELTLKADEVGPVIKAFADHGIEVTALHSHMLEEQPRLFYLHTWATGDAETLARGARAALDQTNTVTGTR
ncbi:MAG TPA: DUF1259 domain-containing protein [Methanocella sp.]